MENKLKKIQDEILPLGLLAVLWAIFHYRILFLGHTFVLLDSSGFFYPLWKWGAEVVRHGLLPLWNPDAGFGTPYLADPQMVMWYPPKFFLYACMNVTSAFNALVLGHHLWTLVGTWVYGRAKGFSRPATLLSCLLFGFSFNLVCLTSTPSTLFAYSWIPWVFWAADGLWDGKKHFFLWFSVACGMQMAAGYPIFAYLTFFALVLEWLCRLWLLQDPKPNPGDRTLKIFGLVGALIIAGFYNASWFFPFIEFFKFSNVGQRLQMSEGMGLNKLITWLNPFYLGHPLFSHPSTLFSMSVYFVGLPTLVLLFWGISRRKTNRISEILFGVALLLSLGETLKVGEWLKIFLPGYQWVARSGYWIPLVIFMVARISMEVSEDFLITLRGRKGNSAVWFVLSVGVFLAALFLGVPWDLASFWLSFALMLLVGMDERFSSRLRWIFLLLAVVLSVGPAVRSVNFTMDRIFYDEKPPLYEKLSLPGRVYHTPSVVEEYRMVSGNSVGEAYGHLKAALIPNWPLAYGLEEVCYSNSLFLNSFLPWYYAPTQISKDGAQKILNYLNVRYVLGQMPANRELVPQLGAPIPLWRNEGTMPKWFSVEAAIPELVWDIDLQKVDRQFFDFSKICFVTYQPKAQRYERRQVQELERTPCSVTLQARGRGEALLVSSETAYPGWKAEVNGFLRPLEGVNYGFRGLLLRDGEEKVKIAYRPASFRLGLFLSLLVVGIWSALLAGTFFTTKGTTRQPLAEGVNEVTKKKKRQRR